MAYGPDIAYGLYEVAGLKADLEFQPWAKVGDKLILADALAEGVFAAANVEAWTRIQTVGADALKGRGPRPPRSPPWTPAIASRCR